MILVPLLVGITILLVASSTRRQVLQELADRERAADLAENPLREAFPHLQLWVPSADAIYQATHTGTGRTGPDIVFTPRRRAFSDAA